MNLGTFLRQEVCQISQKGQVWQKRFLEQQNNIFGHPYGSYIVWQLSLFTLIMVERPLEE